MSDGGEGRERLMEDISDLRQQLNTGGDFFRHAVENAFDPILITTSDLDRRGPRIVFVNRAFSEMTGYTPEEVLGRTPRLLQGPKTDRAVLDRLRQTLSRGEPFRGETVNYRKDGSEFILQWQITALRDPSGRITHFVAIQRDVTPLRQMEESLRHALSEVEERVRVRTADLNRANKTLRREIEQRGVVEEELGRALREAEEGREKLDTILASVADGVLVADSNCRIVLVNRAAVEMLGADPARVLQRPIEEAAPQDGAKSAFKAAICGRCNDEPCDLELLPDDSGRLRTIQVRSSPVRDLGGVRLGTVAVLRDVSRERDVERMKSDFMATAAHELRTPLTSVLGYAEVLLDPALGRSLSPEKQRELLTEIRDQAESLAGTVNLLLDLSRVEKGHPIPLAPAPCDVGRLLARAVEAFRLRSPRHRFEMSGGEEELKISADPQRLRQVLDNLLDNAAKFSPGGALIRVTLEKSPTFCRISVEDNGRGMSPEQTQRIFEPFYRADASNAAPAGLGLGLSIVRAVVEAHGGTLHVESTPGQGTTVSFTLPR